MYHYVVFVLDKAFRPPGGLEIWTSKKTTSDAEEVHVEQCFARCSFPAGIKNFVQVEFFGHIVVFPARFCVKKKTGGIYHP